MIRIFSKVQMAFKIIRFASTNLAAMDQICQSKSCGHTGIPVMRPRMDLRHTCVIPISQPIQAFGKDRVAHHDCVFMHVSQEN